MRMVTTKMNIGSVESKGLELEWSGKLPYNFNYYTSYTYTHSEQKDDIVSNGGHPLPTAGQNGAKRTEKHA